MTKDLGEWRRVEICMAKERGDGGDPPWLFSVVHPPPKLPWLKGPLHSPLPLLSFAEEYLGIYVLHFPSHPGEMTGKFFLKKVIFECALTRFSRAFLRVSVSAVPAVNARIGLVHISETEQREPPPLCMHRKKEKRPDLLLQCINGGRRRGGGGGRKEEMQ